MLQVHGGVQDLLNLLLREHPRQFTLHLGLGNLQIEPGALQCLGVDELQGGPMHLIRAPGNLLILDCVQQIPPHLLWPQFLRGPVEEDSEILHHWGVTLDRAFGKIPQLQIANHAFAQFRHQRPPSVAAMFSNAEQSRNCA
jgi:hypothetical protein